MKNIYIDYIIAFAIAAGMIACFFLGIKLEMENESKPCPNCHLKDSLYFECNGHVKRMALDTSINPNYEMR